MLIVYLVPDGPGWNPITYMVSLAKELLEAELLVLDSKMPNLLGQLETLVLRRENKECGESCLLICGSPTALLSLFLIKNWRKRFRYIAAWVIDSFWINSIPRVIRLSRPFDQLFVTTEEDVPAWTQMMRTPTTWLPWGADVLRLGGNDPERIWDLTRVGRQPPEWDNDLVTQQSCLERKLRFHGRPEEFNNASRNQETLMRHYRQTKFLLAFSSAVNPTNYTHPSREYLTGRWVDALACGSIVAGIAPKEPSIDRLLWSGATLELGTVGRENGLRVITEAVQNWKPEQAERNYRQALERLDWRWRFTVIADAFKESPKRLNHELQLLRHKIEPEPV